MLSGQSDQGRTVPHREQCMGRRVVGLFWVSAGEVTLPSYASRDVGQRLSKIADWKRGPRCTQGRALVDIARVARDESNEK